jgi:hypothetical protein
MVAEVVAETTSPPGQRVLRRAEDHRPFAYARGRDLIRLADHELWARLVDEQLLSVRSGEQLAYQHNDIFYDAESHEPVYYLSPEQPEVL